MGRGRPARRPEGVSTSVYIPTPALEALDRLAKATGDYRTSWIAVLVAVGAARMASEAPEVLQEALRGIADHILEGVMVTPALSELYRRSSGQS